MMEFMSSFFSPFATQNSNTNTNSQNEENIPIELINQLKYFLALIEFKNKYTTCFFVNLDTTNSINSNSYYLCTSSIIISDKDIESKKMNQLVL